MPERASNHIPFDPGREPEDSTFEARRRVFDAIAVLERFLADANGKTQPTQQRARKLLKGWHQIAAALGMTHGDRRDIKRTNAAYGGPITNRGRGTRPVVFMDDLLEWWNRPLASRMAAPGLTKPDQPDQT